MKYNQKEQPSSIEKNQKNSSEKSEIREKTEIIQEIRDRYGILFISTQKKEVFNELGINSDADWFKNALGLPESTERFKAVHAPTENLPTTVKESAIIIGGSSHSVYEPDQPWIQRLEEFIRLMSQKNIPILGVCFGHQLIVQSFGGKVEKNPQGLEFGTQIINLDEKGALDPLYQDIPNEFLAQEAHSDIVTQLPAIKKTAVLARNNMTPYQSLGFGKNVRTIQFHPEVTKEVMQKIIEVRKDKLKETNFIQSPEDYQKLMASIKDTPFAKRVFKNFDKNFIVKYSLKHSK